MATYTVSEYPTPDRPGKLSRTTRSVYVVSAEPSGDTLAVALIRELRTRDPDLAIRAIGGAALAAEGFDSAIDVGPLSVLGFVEGLRALPAVNRLAMTAVQDIVRAKPDAVILIDSWGFMIRVAKLLRLNGLPTTIVKYVAPQVWAMRRGRARVLADYVDHLIALHPFDAPFFRAVGLPTDVVGNPTLDTDWSGGDGAAFRADHAIPPDAPVVFTAFGSRRSEVERLAPVFLDTLATLSRDHPGLVAVAPLVANTADQVRAAIHGHTVPRIVPFTGSPRDALAAADVGLLKSGTITLQAADAGLPSVVAYKVAALTYHAARLLMKSDYITLANVAADRPLMPEFVQDAADPAALATALSDWLNHPARAAERARDLQLATKKMRGSDNAEASASAAEAVLRLLPEL